MSALFSRVMRRTPEILVAAAVAVYLSLVIVGIAEGSELAMINQETLSTGLKLKAFVILFVQPVTMPLVLLFGVALLWRLDRYAITGAVGSGE